MTLQPRILAAHSAAPAFPQAPELGHLANQALARGTHIPVELAAHRFKIQPGLPCECRGPGNFAYVAAASGPIEISFNGGSTFLPWDTALALKAGPNTVFSEVWIRTPADATVDGILYTGINYTPERLAALPYLVDVPLHPTAPDATTYFPIKGMEAIRDLAFIASNEIPNLYANWRAISLKHYADDHVFIVNNADNSQVIFSARIDICGDFRTQAARLDWIMDNLQASAPFGHGPLRAIDLSVGLTPSGVQVPVTFYPATTTSSTSTTIIIRH
jgi:hypothetical protein